jgi:hypothetical protein
MRVVSMSEKEFSRLDILLRVEAGRIAIRDACALMACGDVRSSDCRRFFEFAASPA